MSEALNERFQYIQNQRYIIEIQDKDSGRVYYTKRIGTLAKAVGDSAEYNLMAGISARIFDTKIGEVI